MDMLKDSFSFKGEVKWIKSKDGIILAESEFMPNKIVANDNRGIYLFLDRLAAINTHSANIRYADIGDDNTPATASDTDLGNGLVRAQIGAVSRSGLTADFRFFYADTLTPDDTYEEFGMFVDGSTAVGSGQLFNHLVFSTPLVKATGEDHTVVCRITGSV
jgi:hypothetical protein